jgi:hypothetical protein
MIRTHPRNRIATLLTTNIRDQVARALEHLERSVTIAGYGQHARSAFDLRGAVAVMVALVMRFRSG